MPGDILYFAYGSNMYAPRMCERVASAEFHAIAVLEDYQLRFHKYGQDGTGKCNIVATPGRDVYGVLYTLSSEALAFLDQIEGAGYQRQTTTVCSRTGGRVYRAEVYAAFETAIDDRVLPTDWYCGYVVAGAEMHDLPVGYLASLKATRCTHALRRRLG